MRSTSQLFVAASAIGVEAATDLPGPAAAWVWLARVVDSDWSALALGGAWLQVVLVAAYSNVA